MKIFSRCLLLCWFMTADAALAGQLDPTTPLVVARYNHSATLLTNGKVLVVAGQAGITVLGIAELYDPSAITWMGAASLAEGRYKHTATLLATSATVNGVGRSFTYPDISFSELERHKRLRALYRAATLLIKRALGRNASGPFKADRSQFWDPVAEVCRDLEIAPSKLSSLMKEYCGHSLTQLIDCVRAERIQKTLKAQIRLFVKEWRAHRATLAAENQQDVDPFVIWKALNNFPDLFAELSRLRPLLETQGVIQRHHGGYRLRYRFYDSDAGFTRHHSLALPSEFVIDHVRAILSVWREQRQAVDAIEEQRRETKRKQKRVVAVERQLVQAIAGAEGGGSKRQRRAVAQFDAAREAGPMEILRFSLNGNFGRGAKPGRPRKKRLFYAGWGI